MNKQKLISVILAAVLVSCSSSCTKPDTTEPDTDITEIPVTSAPVLSEAPITPETDAETDEINDPEADGNEQQPAAPITIDYTIPYYDIVEDQMLEYSSTEVFEKDIRPMFFIEKLSELMGTSVAVNSITVNGNAIIVDFSGNGAPVSGCGSYTESVILSSITKVLLDVYNQVNEIYITADGAAYESGHISQPKDTPYATRQHPQLG